MSVATVKARLAQIERTIDGIKTAYAQGPMSLDEANAPLFVNMTREAVHDWVTEGADDDLETRIYAMQLYGLPYGKGVAGEAESKLEPFFSLVRDTFAGRPGLERLEGVLNAVLLGDSGVIIMSYPMTGGTQWWGIEFRLQVREIVPRCYAPGD